MTTDDTTATAAAAIVRAQHVVQQDDGASTCLCCGGPGPFARVVVAKGAAMGTTESQARRLTVLATVCDRCTSLTSPERQADVAELVTAARRVDGLLGLIRHRAGQQLTGWWGGIGACTEADVDEASVAARRAIERVER